MADKTDGKSQETLKQYSTQLSWLYLSELFVLMRPKWAMLLLNEPSVIHHSQKQPGVILPPSFITPVQRIDQLNYVISFLRIWSHLLKKSLMGNNIFCVLLIISHIMTFSRKSHFPHCIPASSFSDLFVILTVSVELIYVQCYQNIKSVIWNKWNK